MKIIDLLVKIANGEEVPKKIKVYDVIWEYNEVYKNYFGGDDIETYGNELWNIPDLNKEVIIIKDTPKEEIQVITRWYPPTAYKKIAKIGKLNKVSDNKQHLNNYILRNKVNEIIDMLSGKDIKEIPQFQGTLEALDKLNLRGKGKPEYLGYSDKECINCGRLRVEKYSDDTEICEKCNFDQNKKEYVLRGETND